MVTLQILVLPFLVRVRVAQQKKRGFITRWILFLVLQVSQNGIHRTFVKRSTFNVQPSNTATMPMVMRQFISMQGCRFPSDVTSMSTPTGPSYHGANRGKRS